MRYEILGPVEESQPLNDRSSIIQALLPALRQVESGGNDYAISPAGAKGPYQFMDATAADVANQLGMANYNIFDNKDAEPMAAHYLGQLYDRYQDPQLALAAYNYGMGNIDKRLKNAPEKSFNAIADTLPKETRNYVPKVMGLVGNALIPSVQAEEPSQIAKPNPRYEILDEVPQNPRYEILGEDVPTEAPQPGYSLQDAAAEVLDYLPFGKKAAAGLSALINYDTPGQYEYAKQKLDENAQRFRDNAGKAAKFGAFATAALPQAVAIPASASSTLLRALATGAGLGAGDALDDATVGKDALGKGILGGGLGAVGGGLGYGLAGALSKAVSSQTAQKTLDNLIQVGKGETGAVNPASTIDSLPDLTKAEAYLTQAAKDVPISKLEAGIINIDEGLKAGVPVRMAEATNSKNIMAQADLLANTGATQEILGGAYDAAAKGAKGRIEENLLKILPESYDAEGNLILSDDAIQYALGKTKDVLETERKQLASKTYDIARKNAPDYVDPTLDRILKVPTIKRILKAEAKAQQDLTGKPISEFEARNFDVFDSLKRRLYELETSAKSKVGKGTLKEADKTPEYYSELRNQLVKAVDFPEYQTARATYAEMSKPLNEIIGNINPETGKQIKGIFTDILKIGEIGKPAEAGNRLLANRPDVIKKIRAAVVRTDPDLEENLLSGVRGALERKLKSSDRGVTKTIKYIQEHGADELSSAIGQEKYQALKGYIDLESLVQEGIKGTRRGSPTAPRLIAEEARKGLLSKINSILTTNWKASLIKNIVAEASEGNNVVSMQVAEILADPKMGKTTLEKMIAYRNITDPRIANAKKFIDLFVNSKTGGQAGAQTATRLLKDDK